MHKPNLTLNSSFSLAGILLVIYSLGITSVINCDTLFIVKLFLTIFLNIGLGYDLYRYAFHRTAHQVIKIWQSSENEWCIQQRNGHILVGKLSKRLLLTTWLVILRLELESHKNRVIILLPDMLKTGELRQLKLYISTT